MQATQFTVFMFSCIISLVQGHKFLIDRDLILQKDGFRFNFRDGEGEVRGTGFQSLGCWKDTWDRAIEPLEGKHKLLMDINYRLREDPLRKCAVAALENHLQLFAIENDGQCLGDKTAAYLYQRFGRAHKCKGFEVKPQSGGYTKWSKWTKCSQACGKGIKKRSRSCTQPRPANGGMDCRRLGPKVQTKSCQNACSEKDIGSLNTLPLSLSPITQTFIVPKVSSFTNSHQSTSGSTHRKDDMDGEDEDNNNNDGDDEDMQKTDMTNNSEDTSKIDDKMTKSTDEMTTTSRDKTAPTDNTKLEDNSQEKTWNNEMKTAHDVLRARWLSIARNRLKTSTQQDEHSSSRQKVVDASLTEGEPSSTDSDDEDEEMNEEMEDEMQESGTKRVTEECICPAVMCLHLADTGVLIDNSNVTEMADLVEMKSFAKGLAAGFGTKEEDIQMGIIAAGLRSHIVVPFHETLPLHDLDRRVDGIRRENGPSALGQAFKRAEAYLLAKQKKAIPPLLNDVLFVMVSGDSDIDVHAPVKDLKSSGAKIVVIGVGKNAKLGKVAQQADKVFMVPPGAGNALVNAIIAAVCKTDLMGKVGPNVKPCPCMLSPPKKRTSSQAFIAKSSPYSVSSGFKSTDSTSGKHQTEIVTKPAVSGTEVDLETTSSMGPPVDQISNSSRKSTNTENTSSKSPSVDQVSNNSRKSTNTENTSSKSPPVDQVSNNSRKSTDTENTSSKNPSVDQISNNSQNFTKPDNTTGMFHESSIASPSIPPGTLPGTSPADFHTNPPAISPATLPATSTNSPTTTKTNDYPNSEQNSVTGDNVIHLTSKTMQPLSKSLSALSDSLNKARAAGELKEGNFTLTKDIKDLLKHITQLKQLADDIRFDDRQSQKEISKEIWVGSQSIPSTESTSQSVSSAEFSSLSASRPKTSNQSPLKPQTNNQSIPKPSLLNDSTLHVKIYSQLKPSLYITNQSLPRPKIVNQSVATGNGNPSPTSTVSHDVKFAQPNSNLQESSLSQPYIISQDAQFLKPSGSSRDVNPSQLSRPPKDADPSQPTSTSHSVKITQLSSSMKNARFSPSSNTSQNGATHWPVKSSGFKQITMSTAATQSSKPVQLPGDKPTKDFFAVESNLAKSSEPPAARPRSSIPDCDINLGFVLDGSASIEGTKRGNFLKMINFVKDIIHEFTELSRQVHVGTLIYSTKTTVVFTFGTKGTEEMIDRLLDNVHYPGQGSLTGNALKESWNTIFSAAPRGRKGVLLLLTDGPSNDDVAAPSKWIKDAGVELFVIGLGNAYDERQLNTMASGPTEEHVMIKQYDELKSSVQEVRNKLCGFNANQILQLMTNPSYNRDDVMTTSQTAFPPNQCILDVAFLLDGSRQVETNGEGNFQRQINFVKKTTKFLPLSRDDVHIGAGLLGDSEVMVFPMNEHYTTNAVDYELDHIRYPASSVIQPQDLKSARDIMLSEGIRDVAPHVFVLVTDVSSLDSYRQAVDDLRKEGNDVVMLGVGSFSWKQEVKVRSTVEGLIDQVVTLEIADEEEAAKQFTKNLCKLAYTKRSDIPHQHWKHSNKVLNRNPWGDVSEELLI